MLRDPSKKPETTINKDDKFTNRQDEIGRFSSQITAPLAGEHCCLPVLNFWGIGGIGKTFLINHLSLILEKTTPAIPSARFDLKNAGDPSVAYRSVLLSLRANFENRFGIKFQNFDLCLAALLVREGATRAPIAPVAPGLEKTLRFVMALSDICTQFPALTLSYQFAQTIIPRALDRVPTLKNEIRKSGRIAEIDNLLKRAFRDDDTLADELIRCFALDLRDGIKSSDRLCRAVVFLDTYEDLWSNQEPTGSYRAKSVSWWVERLSEYCIGANVLIVITGREPVAWRADNPQSWPDETLIQHKITGLTNKDAQTLLSKFEIGEAISKQTPLQKAIIDCCAETLLQGERIQKYHPLYLSLCVDIVLNERKFNGVDPSPQQFLGIPSESVAVTLSGLFLKSLHSAAREAWVKALSITPRFSNEVALAIDKYLQLHNGMAGWNQIVQFSFVELSQADDSYSLHRIMRDAIRSLIPKGTAHELHKWFEGFYADHNEPSLEWYHYWMQEPQAAIEKWSQQYEHAMRTLDIVGAQRLVSVWSEISIDPTDRRSIGDTIWAETHGMAANALQYTPTIPRNDSILAAIERYAAILQVFTETEHAEEWAKTHHNLGIAYSNLSLGNKRENLENSIRHLNAALHVRTENSSPRAWAETQSALGVVHRMMHDIGKPASLEKALECHQAALRHFSKEELPEQWAMTQNNLGTAYYSLSKLASQDQATLRIQARDCFVATLDVYTRDTTPTEWASSHLNLGALYLSVAEEETEETIIKNYISTARDHLSAASVIYTRDKFPWYWATVQNTLGNLHLTAASHGSAEEKQEQCHIALQFYESALTVRHREHFPLDWAHTNWNMGMTCSQ
jgi:tetratricopeptide (TPR) repeat protein